MTAAQAKVNRKATRNVSFNRQPPKSFFNGFFIGCEANRMSTPEKLSLQEFTVSRRTNTFGILDVGPRNVHSLDTGVSVSQQNSKITQVVAGGTRNDAIPQGVKERISVERGQGPVNDLLPPGATQSAPVN
jgi:hypothetical protein